LVNIEIIIGLIALGVVGAVFIPLAFDPKSTLDILVCDENELLQIINGTFACVVDPNLGTGGAIGTFANENTEFRPHLVRGTNVQDPVKLLGNYSIRVLEFLDQQTLQAGGLPAGEVSWDYLVPEDYETGEDLEFTLYFFKEDGNVLPEGFNSYYEEVTACQSSSGSGSGIADITPLVVQDGVEFDFKDGSDYLIMVSASFSGADTSTPYEVFVEHGTTIFDGSNEKLGVFNKVDSCTTQADFENYFWFTVYSPNAVEATEDLSVTFRTNFADKQVFLDDVTFSILELASNNPNLFVEGQDWFFNLNSTDAVLGQSWDTPNDATISFIQDNNAISTSVIHDNTVDNSGGTCTGSSCSIDIAIGNDPNMMILVSIIDHESGESGFLQISSVDEETNTNVGTQVDRIVVNSKQTMEVWQIMDTDITNKGGNNTITINLDDSYTDVLISVSSFLQVDQIGAHIEQTSPPPDDIDTNSEISGGVNTLSVTSTPLVPSLQNLESYESLIHSFFGHGDVGKPCTTYGAGQVERSNFDSFVGSSEVTLCVTTEITNSLGTAPTPNVQTFNTVSTWDDHSGIISSAYAPAVLNEFNTWLIFGTATYGNDSGDEEDFQTRLFATKLNDEFSDNLPEVKTASTSATIDEKVHTFHRVIEIFADNVTFSIQSQMNPLNAVSPEERLSSAIFALNMNNFVQSQSLFDPNDIALQHTTPFGNELNFIINNPIDNAQMLILADFGVKDVIKRTNARVQINDVDTVPSQTSQQYEFDTFDASDNNRWGMISIEPVMSGNIKIDIDASEAEQDNQFATMRSLTAITLFGEAVSTQERACFEVRLMGVPVGDDLSSGVVPTFTPYKEECIVVTGGADILRSLTFTFNVTENPFNAEEVGVIQVKRDPIDPLDLDDYIGKIFVLFGELQWVVVPPP